MDRKKVLWIFLMVQINLIRSTKIHSLKNKDFLMAGAVIKSDFFKALKIEIV